MPITPSFVPELNCNELVFSGRIKAEDYGPAVAELVDRYGGDRRHDILLCTYERDVDFSQFDAAMIEELIPDFIEADEVTGGRAASRTAHVCPWSSARTALIHYIERIRGRLYSHEQIFDTRPEALAWLKAPVEVG